MAFAAGYYLTRRSNTEHARVAQADAERILEEARTRQKELVLEAKEEAVKLKTGAEQDARQRRAEVQRQEQRLAQREEQFERKLESLEKRDKALVQQEQELQAMRTEAERLGQERRGELERIAGLSGGRGAGGAGGLDRGGGPARGGRPRAGDRDPDQGRGRQALPLDRGPGHPALRRGDHGETTQSSVAIPNDEMKGRIIGKEGRNIRALEQATGRRPDHRRHPGGGRPLLLRPRAPGGGAGLPAEADRGRALPPARGSRRWWRGPRRRWTSSCGRRGRRPPTRPACTGCTQELIRTMGRLKFRYSYGQNQLTHSLEVSFLAAAMAAELGADVNVCRRGGFLHDIGKAVDHEVDGPHAIIGADLAQQVQRPRRGWCTPSRPTTSRWSRRRWRPSSWPPRTPSPPPGPGARRETVENYIKRLEALEDVALGFKGVDKAYALQAGREVRVMVKPDQVDEDEAWRLNRDIVKRIEDTLDYPGQIKVTVIRETRVVDYAK